MMKSILKIVCLALIVATFSRCSSDDKMEMYDYGVKVNIPADLQGVDASGLDVILKNTSTGYDIKLATNAGGIASFTGLPGVYNIEVSGTKTYTFELGNGKTETRTVKLIGLRESVALSAGSKQEAVQAIISLENNSGWVIKEIFYQGGKTPNNATYFKDQFVEIYNNTDTVMYADGISIAEVAHYTTAKYENIYKADIDKFTFLHTVYTVPGSGKDVKVEPGKSILIAPAPINHKTTNANSIDLSMADFQWFDNDKREIDVPEVPNLITNYTYTLTCWVLNMGGASSFVIFKAPMDNFTQDYMDTRPNNAGNAVKAVKIPNKYVLDAVELSHKTNMYSKGLSASIDAGYTYCETTLGGKSVRRKIESVRPDGRIVYKDTNNSSLDFIPSSNPLPKGHDK